MAKGWPPATRGRAADNPGKRSPEARCGGEIEQRDCRASLHQLSYRGAPPCQYHGGAEPETDRRRREIRLRQGIRLGRVSIGISPAAQTVSLALPGHSSYVSALP